MRGRGGSIQIGSSLNAENERMADGEVSVYEHKGAAGIQITGGIQGTSEKGEKEEGINSAS